MFRNSVKLIIVVIIACAMMLPCAAMAQEITIVDSVSCGEAPVPRETVEALDHTEVVDAAVAPTCTETGLTEGSHCSVCGEVLVAQETVEALGHTEVVDASVEPTCTETGLTEGSHCTVCGEILVAQEILPVSHTLDANCVCSICGEILHEFNEEGFCNLCGCYSCPHETTESRTVVENAVYRNINAVTHTLADVETVSVVCADCGHVVSCEQELSNAVQRVHTYMDAGCECGYVCTHIRVSEEISGRSYVRLIETTPYVHTYLTEATVSVVCNICNSTISSYEQEENFSEEHYFEDAACWFCGYENTLPECTHERLDFSHYYDNDYLWEETTGYKDITDTGHTRVYNAMADLSCPDCEFYDTLILAENLETEQTHIFYGGVCECGYGTPDGTGDHTFSEGSCVCLTCGETMHQEEDWSDSHGVCLTCGELIHNLTRAENIESVSGYVFMNESFHYVTGSATVFEYCWDCKLVMKETHYDAWSMKEEHIFDNGLCACCGFEGCDHKTVVDCVCADCGKEVHENPYSCICFACGRTVHCHTEERFGYVNAAYKPYDDARHWAEGDACVYLSCWNCNMDLQGSERIIAQGVRELEAHMFVYRDGVRSCMDCGYVWQYVPDVCSHENIELRRYEFIDRITEVTETHEIGFGEIVEYDYCLDCEAWLNRRTVDDDVPMQVQHKYLISDNQYIQCFNCDYEFVCLHNNVDWYVSEYYDGVYGENDNDTHTFKGMVFLMGTCEDCGIPVYESGLDGEAIREYHETILPHNMVGCACADCGYSTHRLEDGCICADCGETIHTYGANCVCAVCGTELHDLNILCTCRVCGESFHDEDGDCYCSFCCRMIHTPDENCVCTVCGAINHAPDDNCLCANCNRYIHTPDADCVCTACGEPAHTVTNGCYCDVCLVQAHNLNGDCVCSLCGETFHEMVELGDEWEPCYVCTRCNYGDHWECSTSFCIRDAVSHVSAGEAGHYSTGTPVMYSRCGMCRMIVDELVTGDTRTLLEDHNYDDSQTCTDCGYQRDDHVHSFESGSCVCTGCGETVHSYYIDACDEDCSHIIHSPCVCGKCGYTKAHNYEQMFYRDRQEYSYCNESWHNATIYACLKNECTNCGTVDEDAEVIYLDPMTEMQRHNYEDDASECLNCGHPKGDCAHEETYAERRSWIYDYGPTYAVTDTHRTGLGYTSETVYCGLCGNWISSQVVEQDIVLTVEHSYDTDGKCGYCGYAPECDHANLSERLVEMEAWAACPVDEKNHTVVGMGYFGLVCDDCGATFDNDGLEWRYAERAESHNLISGTSVCRDCGYCPHETTDTTTVSETAVYCNINTFTHTLADVETVSVVCADCGHVFSREQKLSNAVQRVHTNLDTSCECGYVCPHEKTHEEINMWTILELVETTPYVHTYQRNATVRMECDECCVTINSYERLENYTEPHSYDEEDTCYECGYVNPASECSHERLDLTTYYYEDYLWEQTTGYTNITETGHTRIYDVGGGLSCPDCDYWEELVVANGLEKTEGHDFYDGVCGCGYGTSTGTDEHEHTFDDGICTCLTCGETVHEEDWSGEHPCCARCGELIHWTDSKQIFESIDKYTFSNGQQHYVTGVAMVYEYCSECHLVMDATRYDAWTTSEEHTFENGVCTGCGYEGCNHTNVVDCVCADCGNEVHSENSGCMCAYCGKMIHPYAGERFGIVNAVYEPYDSVHHWAEGDACVFIYCEYCKLEISDSGRIIAEDVRELEYHHFVYRDGVRTCLDCGYVWTYEDTLCAHAHTELRRKEYVEPGQITEFTATHEIGIGRIVEQEYCLDCSTVIASTTIGENVPVQVPHVIKISEGSGRACFNCSYRFTCLHEHIKWTPNKCYDGMYVENDKDSHIFKGMAFLTGVCEDCGIPVYDSGLDGSSEANYCEVVLPHNADGCSCTDCGAELHTPVDVTRIEPSDFAAGRTEGVVCSACDTVISGCETIPAFCVIENGVLTEYNGTTAELVIPADIGVAEIGMSAFANNTALTGVVIPDGVTHIGNNAFSGCVNLTEIIVSDDVTTIDNSAFALCSSLTEVVIPGSTTAIGDYVFSRCNSLARIVIPESVSAIGDGVFSDCYSLETVVMPGDVTPSFTLDIPAEFTVYCYMYSNVDYWAEENGYNIIYIDETWPAEFSLHAGKDALPLGESMTVATAIFPPQDEPVILWSSSEPDIVSVENGVVTAHAAGTATITAVCGTRSASLDVTAYIPSESFELSENEIWMITKTNRQVNIVNVLPENALCDFEIGGYDADTTTLTIVNEDGNAYIDVRGRKPGDTTFTVTDKNSGAFRECVLHVFYPVTAIAFEEAVVTVPFDTTLQLAANVTANTQNCVNRLVTFESADPEIASVDENGIVTGRAWGTTTITATAESGVTASCEVTVTHDDHDLVTDEAVSPTCATTGLTEGSHCAACRYVAVPQEVIETLSHTEVTDAAVEPTCTATGLTEGKHCSVCGEVLTAQETIPALGHTEVFDAAVEPTCAVTGLTEGKHCSVCGEVLTAQETIPTLGHAEVIDEAVEPSCAVTGLTEGKHCSDCGEVVTAQETIPALGHTEVIDAAVEPTCTATGLTEGKHCLYCGVMTEQTIIPALGHTEVIDAAVEPTCTAAGLTKGRHCSVCGEVLIAQETVPAFGHTEVIDAAVEPTCTTSGLTEGKHCSVCGETLAAQEIVDALGHEISMTQSTFETSAGGEVAVGFAILCGHTEDAMMDWVCEAPDIVEFTGVYAGPEEGLFIAGFEGKATGVVKVMAACADSFCTIIVHGDTQMTLPAMLKAIDEEAFMNSSVQEVVLPEGIETIGNRAFADCAELGIVHMPDSIDAIADDAFDGCGNVTFICASDNTAAKYAAEHGIPCIIQ